MTASQIRFIQPSDVLILRGNRLFGEAGSYGESMMPPWPSVAAGALRSRMLADHGVDFTAFADGRETVPELGTPQTPGSFCLSGFHLARRDSDGSVELLLPQPADLVAAETDDGIHLSSVQPQKASQQGFASSWQLPALPVLPETQRTKPVSGYWLRPSAWQRYLAGDLPQAGDLVHYTELWSLEHRTGVKLETERQRAEDGHLFSNQVVVMHRRGDNSPRDGSKLQADTGFLAAVQGAMPPHSGALRFGGDGRAAYVSACEAEWPSVDLEAIVAQGRCRIILASPAIFPEGSNLPGLDEAGRLNLPGLKARLVSAAVPRFEVVSGWDLAKRRPKPALRCVPSGAVYWLDELETSAEALDKLVNNGLWSDPCEDVHRKAEGFNRCWVAPWMKENENV